MAQFNLTKFILIFLAFLYAIAQEVEVTVEEEVAVSTDLLDGSYRQQDLETCLRMGTQFVAAQAVQEGVFPDSEHNISNIYSYTTAYLDYNLGWDYTFDVEIMSPEGVKARTQFTVQDAAALGEDYLIRYSSFKLIDGDGDGVDLTYVDNSDDDGDNADGGFYKYYSLNATNGSNTTADLPRGTQSSPAQRWNLSETDILSRYGWTRARNTSVYSSVLDYGKNYTIRQAILNELLFFVSDYNLDEWTLNDVNSAYVRNLGNGTVDYRFNIHVESPNDYTAMRVNFHMRYESSTRAITPKAWSVHQIWQLDEVVE